MPTYEYECEACGHAFEQFQSITAPPIKKCPNCDKKKVKRLLGTGAGLIFKGKGFYITDYRSDSYNKAASADKSSSDGASGNGEAKTAATSTDAPAPKAESKSESKPAAKAESKPATKPESKSKSK